MRETSQLRKIAFVGDHLPRKCGIATFLWSDGFVGLYKKAPAFMRDRAGASNKIGIPANSSYSAKDAFYF